MKNRNIKGVILVKNRGFVLVELIVAILIIGILSSVTSLSIIKSQKVSRDTQRKTDLSQIEKTLESYYSANHKYPSSSSEECKPQETGTAGVFVDSAGCNEVKHESWEFDMTTESNKQEVWINSLVGYTDKLPNDPKGNGGASPCAAPVFEDAQTANEHFYAYYSKSCAEMQQGDAKCPYYKSGTSGANPKSFIVGSFYILAVTLENGSDLESVGKAGMYYTDCSQMKGNETYNQNAYVKIKAL